MLLQTPRRGLLSAKLSSFTGPEEEEESEEEPDEKQQNLHTTKRDILYKHVRARTLPTLIQQAGYYHGRKRADYITMVAP